jgi:hypothetical protein
VSFRKVRRVNVVFMLNRQPFASLRHPFMLARRPEAFKSQGTT